MLNGLFVAGTDTSVGKTVVSAALMHRYRERYSLKYWKPIQTGSDQEDDTAVVRQLGACSSEELLPPGIRLRKAYAPYLAAQMAGTEIRLYDLMQATADEAGSTRWIVEGAGGILVPINESEFMIDLIAHLDMAVLVVARSTLGTINHTLLTLEMLRRRALNVAGVVMVGDRNRENREAIERWGNVEVFGEMPHFPSLTPDVVRSWATMELDPQEHLSGYLS